ncbi:selenoprotein V-like [Daphnia pulex]|uniref:selenoprotein V-like n=1 Tax=Daphnia pulex TaxID=6669 RepID=UPI001EDCEF67|nr:selenoprotein V-like [Daphnia pulex]
MNFAGAQSIIEDPNEGRNGLQTSNNDITPTLPVDVETGTLMKSTEAQSRMGCSSYWQNVLPTSHNSNDILTIDVDADTLMNFENTFNLPPGVSPIRMVQLPQPSTLCRPTLVRPPTPVGPLNTVRPSTPLGPPTPVRPPTPFRPPTPVRPPTPMRQPTPQPNRPILLLQRSQHPSSLLPLDQLIHPTPTQPSTSMKRSNSPHQVLLQPSVGATSSSPPSPHSTVLQTSLMTMPSSSPSSHSTVVQPPMTTIPSGSSSPHSTVSTAEQPSSRHSPSSTSGTSDKCKIYFVCLCDNGTSHGYIGFILKKTQVENQSTDTTTSDSSDFQLFLQDTDSDGSSILH